MFLLEEPFTDLSLHLRHKIILRLHQPRINLPGHIGKEIGVKLAHLLRDDAINSHLISRLGIGGQFRVGDCYQGILHSFDEEEDGCDFVG